MTQFPNPNMTPEQGQPDPATSKELTGSLSNSSNKEASSQFRHELRNVLQAILIQVQCANIAIDKADESATRSHLSQIESSVAQSRQLLDKFVPPRDKR